MAERARPRRPAMLEPGDAENIQGDEDPAQSSAVAHTSARALVGTGTDEDFDQETIEKLVCVIEEEGVDTVSVLWSRSPATTLPGALWRLYLVREWYRRDGATVRTRFLEGRKAPLIPGVDDVASIDLPGTIADIEDLMHARLSGNIADLLDATASLMRVLAAGATFGAQWIATDTDDLADLVTRRAGALLATAEEFEAAARRARAGKLD